MWAEILRSVALLALVQGTIGSPLKGCTDGITCTTVAASGLAFDCRFGGASLDNPVGNVMLLHGFPEWSDMYMPLMRLLANEGYKSVACNQRGYSPGAAPDNVADYNYNVLRDDVFNIADAVNFTGQFHLVGHDHGAALGFYAAASPRGEARILSYSSLSIPHLAAFADGLFGPTADIEQQIASQYFTMYVGM